MLSDEEKELIEKIQNGNKIGIYELIRTFKKEGIENFITVRRKYIDIMINLIEKQSKEIEEMKKQIDLDNECEIALNSKVMDLEKEIEELKTINQMQKYRTEVIDERELISKDKIKEILGIEEDINNEKLLSLLQTIVDEYARLEDVEDRKVQIEYNNVFNKGVKSVEDKIKAKIEELKEDIKYSANPLSIDNSKFGIKVLQSLLEKE